MDLNPDTLLKERYRILRKLGQGGMGAVYLAQDLSLDHEVAVKSNQNASAQGANLFLREARLLAMLRHPHLPRVTDYFILGDEQYLVMDYIPGQGLDEILKNEGAQPLARVLPWVRELGEALAYLHTQTPPVVHRDVKPGNVKLSADGQAVLVDFGIAKAIASDQATATNLHGYTPGYAPPEQYGGGQAGPAADQYALAATIYNLLSGQKPSDAIQRLLGQAVLTPLTVLSPAIPVGVEAVLERALSIRPEERFQGVEALVRAFEAAAGAPAPGVQESAAAAVQATVVRAPGGTPVSPGLPPVPPPVSGAPRKVPLAVLIVGGVFGGLFVLGCVAILGWFVLRGGAGVKAAASATPVPQASSTSAAAVQPTPRPSQTPSRVVPSQTATLQLPSDTAEPPTLEPSATSVPASATPPPLGQGGLIAFVSDRGDGKTLQIWVVNAWLNDQGQVEAGEARQLTSSDGDKRQPRWSPDGSELLYVAAGPAGNGLDIWKMKADGSAPAVDISNHKGNESAPAWSPDGKLIAFTEDQRQDGVLQLYVMNADGSGLYKLSFEQDESAPTWSPKMDWLGFVMNVAGNRIFYLRAPIDPAAATPQPAFYVTPQAFDHFDLKGNLGQVDEPAWSPDGNWIAYTRVKLNGERIFLARYPLKVLDQDLISLTNGSRDLSPAWSPDSQWIAFVSYRDGNPEIYVMRSTGKSQGRLTDAPGRDLDPAWQVLR